MDPDLPAIEIIVFTGAGVLIMIALALTVVVYSNRAQRKILTQRMQAQAAEIRHQQELVQRNLATQEEERKRIAGNLHDDIGSKLGVLHLSFHRLRRSAANSGLYAALCEEIESLLATTLETTRRISHELLPPILEDFGLFAALEELCEGIRNTGSVEIEFRYDLDRTELGSATTELNLIRIVQELCNNTLKYAGASRICIQLTRTPEGKCLQYDDNGHGFDPAALQNRGLGMKNLESRARIIGGTRTIRTAPGAGFSATVVF